MTIQTGIDGYPEWARVHRPQARAGPEFPATARWSEYVQTKDEWANGQRTGKKTVSEVLDSSRTRSTARLLLVVLAEQAHEDDICWPGVDRLAGRGNTNRSRVPPPATPNRLIAEVTARLEKV